MLPTYIGKKSSSYVNPMEDFVTPFTLTDSLSDQFTIPATSSVVRRFIVDNNGHFEIFSTAFVIEFPALSDLVFLNIKDMGTRRNLMIEPMQLNLLAGRGTNPFIWPESYFLNVTDGPREIQIEFNNTNAVPATISFTFYGRRWYQFDAPGPIQEKMENYFQNNERTNVYFLTSNETITIPGSSSLLGTAAPIFRASDEAPTEIVKALSTIHADLEGRLVDDRTGKSFSNGFVPFNLMFGTVEFPFIFPETLIIDQNYRLRLEIINSAVGAQTVGINYASRRLYI